MTLRGDTGTHPESQFPPVPGPGQEEYADAARVGDREALGDIYANVLSEHGWQLVRDGGTWTWTCVCGINDHGSEVENPSRHVRHPTPEEATRAAVGHIAVALSEWT